MTSSVDQSPIFVHTEVVEPFAENSRLVACQRSRAAILVDPGGHVDRLLAVAEEADFDVQAIWLTHAHLDHVTGVGDAIARLGEVPILLHPDDLQLYEAVAQQGMMFGFPVDQPPPPTQWLETGETLALGQLRAEVLFLPGHSPGHVGFWFEGEAALLSGDVLFAGSIGRTDLPGGDHDTLMRSIHEHVLPLGDEVRVLSGHGPDTTIGRERGSNPFLTGRV
jgi:hydroxyacylglutathione hydrolase